MENKVISLKANYYIALAVFGLSTGFLAYVNDRLNRQPFDVMIYLVIAIMSADFFWTLFYVNKFVYGKIDTQKQELVFGNLFFLKAIPLKQVRIVWSKILWIKVMKFRAAGNEYYIFYEADDDPRYLASVEQ